MAVPKYLDYSGLSHFWSKIKVKFARHDDSIEYINGSQSAATGSWTGATKDTSLYTGKTIAYRLPYAGSGNATLNLTFPNGTTSGAKAVYSMTTRVTTHYPAGSVIHMTYDGSNWRTTGWYNTNNFDRLLHNNYLLAKSALTANKISAAKSDGYFNLAASTAFDMTFPLVLPTGAVAAAAQFTAYETYPSVNPATTATVQGVAVNKMVFLKGTVSGNTFTTAASNWLTCTIPTSADSFYYMPIGVIANDATTKMFFNPSNVLFAYINGAFQKVEIAASKNLLEQIYPVGSVYINASNSTNPATLLGFGTWSRVGTGRVMIDADSTYGAGSTGGSSTHTHTTGDHTLTAAESGVPAHGHGNTIKATTPKFTHSITQPTFNTPKLTHTITQPVFKYTAPASHKHYEHYRIAREGSSNYIHIAAYGNTNPSTAFTQKNNRGAVTDQAISGNQILYEDGQMIVQAAYVGEGHSSSTFAQYNHIYPCHTQAATGAGTTDGTTAKRDTNVGVNDHAAAACSRATNVGVDDHAATACTMSGSVSNNTAAAASSAHNHGDTGSGTTIQPWVGVYMWKRTA